MEREKDEQSECEIIKDSPDSPEPLNKKPRLATEEQQPPEKSKGSLLCFFFIINQSKDLLRIKHIIVNRVYDFWWISNAQECIATFNLKALNLALQDTLGQCEMLMDLCVDLHDVFNIL